MPTTIVMSFKKNHEKMKIKNISSKHQSSNPISLSLSLSHIQNSHAKTSLAIYTDHTHFKKLFPIQIKTKTHTSQKHHACILPRPFRHSSTHSLSLVPRPQHTRAHLPFHTTSDHSRPHLKPQFTHARLFLRGGGGRERIPMLFFFL